MGSFGERLRREREMRGITLEEIAEATKIGSRSLRALETENFQQLPGGIFNKGFVRSYARYLGIDAEQAVADFLAAEASHLQNAPAGTPNSGGDSSTSASHDFGSLLIIAGVVIVIAALAFGAWKYWTSRSARAGPEVSSATPLQSAPVAKPRTISRSAANLAASASTAAPAATTTAPVPSVADPKTTALPANTDGFTVSVRARQDSWISVNADGKTVIEDGMLRASAEQSFRARDRLVMKLGNAGGVDVSYNGKPLALSAQSNQVKTLVFTPQGLSQ